MVSNGNTIVWVQQTFPTIANYDCSLMFDFHLIGSDSFDCIVVDGPDTSGTVIGQYTITNVNSGT